MSRYFPHDLFGTVGQIDHGCSIRVQGGKTQWSTSSLNAGQLSKKNVASRVLKILKIFEYLNIWIFAQSGFKAVKHNDQHPATASLLNAGQLSKKNFASRILLDPNVVQIQFINMLSRFCKCAIALFAADLPKWSASWWEVKDINDIWISQPPDLPK